MYVLHPPHQLVRRRPSTDSLLRRAGWALLALVAAALLGLGYAAAGEGQASGDQAPAETVTVVSGDTLWAIASRRYPDRDVRREVAEIERLNGLSGPTIEVGQRLKVPPR